MYSMGGVRQRNTVSVYIGSFNARVLSRILSVLRVIGFHHHPISTKWSQDCLYGFPLNSFKCPLNFHLVFSRYQFTPQPQAYILLCERNFMFTRGRFLVNWISTLGTLARFFRNHHMHHRVLGVYSVSLGSCWFVRFRVFLFTDSRGSTLYIFLYVSFA